VTDRKRVWVCGACGKIGATRDTVGDESCYMWSVECWEDSVLRDLNGNVRGAQAVPKDEVTP
jgi:hypothetical protein